MDAYEEHKDNVDAIVALLPKDFKAGMENWGGDVYEHISDTNFGLLLHDMIQQRPCIVYATDLDGDRLTDLMADAPDVLRAWGQIVLDKVGAKVDMKKLWTDMGFTMTNGKDMTSVMYRIARRADLRTDARFGRRDAAAPAGRRRNRRRRRSSRTIRASTSC